MTAVHDESTIPDNRAYPASTALLEDIRGACMHEPIEGLPVLIDQHTDRGTLPSEQSNSHEKAEYHDLGPFAMETMQDVYMEDVLLHSQGAINTLRKMLEDGIDGHYISVATLRKQLIAATACSPPPLSVAWKTTSALVTQFVTFPHNKPAKGGLDGVQWKCSRCGTSASPSVNTLPRMWHCRKCFSQPSYLEKAAMVACKDKHQEEILRALCEMGIMHNDY